MLHPERYAIPKHLHAIRSFNLVGAILLLFALATVVYDVVNVSIAK